MPGPAAAQVPGIISYQGRLTVHGTNFNGVASFKFALVNGTGDATYWSHNGTSAGGQEPSGPAISLPVSRGIYSVNLGDLSVSNMTQSIPASVFTNREVYLRVWVDDGKNGSLQLAPDRRITAVGYALTAASVQGPIPAANLTGSLPPALIESSLPSGTMLVSARPDDPAFLTNGYQSIMSVPPPAWQDGSASNAPSARYGQSAVWDGDAFIVWGGRLSSGGPVINSGGIYRPDSDSWQSVSTVGAPSARFGQSALWTGAAMIIWGGNGASGYVDTGGRFQPQTQQWLPVSTNGAPAARSGQIAVWTGNLMVIWGGRNNAGLLNDGALYDPAKDQWTPINLTNAPEARFGASAVWAGDRVLIWGGEGASGELSSGAELLFSGGLPVKWMPMSVTNAPAPRRSHSVVWTGHQMIVWGGQAGGTPLGDGGAFDPASNSWQALPTAGAPAARYDHSALWTGQVMVILDGANSTSELASGSAYDPTTGQWWALSIAGAPLARSQASAVWTGREALLFGGQANGRAVAALQSLVPQRPWYFYRKL